MRIFSTLVKSFGGWRNDKLRKIREGIVDIERGPLRVIFIEVYSFNVRGGGGGSR